MTSASASIGDPAGDRGVAATPSRSAAAALIPIGPATGPSPSAADGGQPRRRLLKGIVPHAGESLRSLVARACHANHLPNSWGLVRHFGMKHRQQVTLSEDADVVPADLAYALGTDSSEVETRRYDPIGRGHRSFFGLGLHEGRIESDRRRFSPASLAGLEIHRAAWELRDIPFCNVGWDMLRDECPCSIAEVVTQRWIRTASNVGHCDGCGRPLARIEPVPVPLDMREALSLYAGLADPDVGTRAAALSRLPGMIRTCDRGRLFDAITLLARLIDPGDVASPPDTPADRLASLHAASAAMLEWPTGLRRLRPSDDFGQAHWQRAAALYMALSSPRASEPIPQPTTSVARRPGVPVNRAEAKKLESVIRAKRDKSERATGLVGLSKAAQIARIKSTKLLAAWNDGRVTQHFRQYGDRIVPAFDVREAKALTGLPGARVEARALAVDLGISQYGVEQIAALGLLPSHGSALIGMGPFFEPDAIEAWLQLLSAAAADRAGDQVSLRDAMRGVTGRLKPWGPAFASMSAGALRFSATADSGALVGRLTIARADIPVVAALVFDRAEHRSDSFSTSMNKTDALDCLNLGHQRGAALASLPLVGELRKRYNVLDVENLILRFTTTREVATELDVSCMDAHLFLMRAGLRPHARYLWHRQETAAAVSAARGDPAEARPQPRLTQQPGLSLSGDQI